MQAIQSLARFFLNHAMLQRLRGPFHHVEGNAWSVALPDLTNAADTDNALRRSPLTLFEDHMPLRTAHALHATVKEKGSGHYSHWKENLIFSATDNSDPNTNGRRYHISCSPWFYQFCTGRRGHDHSDQQQPTNYLIHDSSPEAIHRDVDYTLSSSRTSLELLRRLGSLRGKSLLEIGPGHNFGTVMLFSAYGARPMILDRFLPAWQEPYHTLFYTQLRDTLARLPDVDVAAIDALVQAHGYPKDVITCYESPLEDAPIAKNSIDITISNAVMEHVFDADRAFAKMYRITRPGGCGLHQVDCRDHRDFSRPLEYLTLEDGVYRDLFETSHAECGNRLRPAEYLAKMKRAGFHVVGYEKQTPIDADYLDEFVPRLRAAAKSSYRDLARDDLVEIAFKCLIRKPA